jgi:hypothetical protein
MTNDVYEKATEIQKQLDRFKTLRYMANKPFKRYFYKTTIFGMSTYDRSEVCLCDDGLTEVIREYCDKRIKELQDELEAL